MLTVKSLSKEYKNVHAVEKILNGDLETISEWVAKWFVNFNLKKTFLVNFSLKKKKSYPRLVFGEESILPQKHHKHLGIILSEDLKWSEHIQHIVSKASQKLGALGRQTGKFSRTQYEKIYLNMIRPSLEYDSVIFSNFTAKDSKRFDGVQRRAAVLCSGTSTKTALAIVQKLFSYQRNWGGTQ